MKEGKEKGEDREDWNNLGRIKFSLHNFYIRSCSASPLGQSECLVLNMSVCYERTKSVMIAMTGMRLGC